MVHRHTARPLQSVGKPLMVGLLIMASVLGLVTCLVVSSLWVLGVDSLAGLNAIK
jgi:hypothetical protein